jgi:hypothetical protein
MERIPFSINMKILFLTCIFLCVVQIVSGPTKDFILKAIVFEKVNEFCEQMRHESEFTRFLDDLGRRESGNNWRCINSIGCFGEWQFAETTVRYLGFRNVTLRKFRKNPDIFPRELQRKALESLIKVNLVYLKDYGHYMGDTIKGVIITKSGLIAASHLGGAGSVKQFLASNGRINRKDAYGTSVKDYMRKFGDYDLD